MATMIHYTDLDEFTLADIATATDTPGIWLYPEQHSEQWDGRYAVAFKLLADWQQYEYQRFTCGDGSWWCSDHAQWHNDGGECPAVLVECFLPASDFHLLEAL